MSSAIQSREINEDKMLSATQCWPVASKSFGEPWKLLSTEFSKPANNPEI